ncbi:MAG: hypothetical protein K9J12_06960 [Melioribacteraceae bacterium]|nr:hypothetical protein [Melioribacteraceae bacterium]MCF8263804.1 hypothetical protein [Melioribacteraceae bacterium]MCF8412109.1 hypothetical protein [Melioribacteraceae bacterium]MCF8432361.1 hypothetical protein [Melioribacteraceae bacterium]
MNKKIIFGIFTTIFAFFLWGFVTLSEEFSANINLPVNYIDIPEGYAIGSTSHEFVSINLKGEGWLLAQYTFGANLSLNISVESKEGTQNISVLSSLYQNEWLSSNISVNGVNPDVITITLETLTQKKVPISSNLDLEMRPGYELVSDVLLLPDSVVITGPVSVVKKIDSVNTKNVEVDNLDSGTSFLIELENLKMVEFDIPTVQVELDIQKIVDRTFEDVDIEIKNIRSNYELLLIPGKVNVVLRGGMQYLSKMTKADISVIVNFEDAYSDTLGTIKPIISHPRNSNLLQVKPEKLEYVIKQY